MNRLYTVILAIILCTASLFASEPIDSLSYTLGYMLSRDTSSDSIKDKLLNGPKDYDEYIRGIKNKLSDIHLMSDSSYMVSYSLGATEGTFMSDGFSHQSEDIRPPVSCIVAGLRKVGNNELTLPADTADAHAFIERYYREKADTLDAETLCKFYTAYGTMKAYQPGLQEYINSIMPGTRCVGNRRAYATGFADILEAAMIEPRGAYELGKRTAISAYISAKPFEPFDEPSFIKGVKASLGLDEPLISSENMEEIIRRHYMPDDDVQVIEWSETEIDSENEDDTTPKVVAITPEYDNDNAIDRSKLEMKLDTRYAVDWTVTVNKVATVDSPVIQHFHDMMHKIGVEEFSISCSVLMTDIPDNAANTLARIDSIAKAVKLPETFRWFYRKNNDGSICVGIMNTCDSFSAHVDTAVASPNKWYPEIVVVRFNFDPVSSIYWAKFTEENIGQYATLEINGEFICAPCVNAPITGGACAVTGFTADTLNRLFKGAAELAE